jgi:hypothetical protein
MALEFQWARQGPEFNTIGGNAIITSIVADSNNNSYVVYASDFAVSGQTSSGNYDIILVKFDPDGNVLWVRQNSTFNTNASENDASITIDNQGNLLVSYISSGLFSGGTKTSTIYADIIVSKFDPNGNLIWIKQNPYFSTTEQNNLTNIGTDGTNI